MRLRFQGVFTWMWWGGRQGVWLRDYVPVNARREGDPEYSGDDMGEVRPSNAYQRRVAGVPPLPAKEHAHVHSDAHK